MATRKPAVLPAPARRSGGTALVPWKERLAESAQKAVEQEAGVGTSSWITFPAGIMTYKGVAVPGNELDLVVLDSMHENNYYTEAWDPDNPANPSCFAYGRDDAEMAPHEKSEEAQADACTGCQWNQWGTAVDQRGKPRKGKRCQQRRRLMLLPADALQRGPEGIEKSEIAFTKIPVTSVKGWAAYVKTLAAQYKLPPFVFITKMKSERDAEVQTRVTFETVGAIEDEGLVAALERKIANHTEDFIRPYEKREESAKPAPRRAGPPKARKY